VRTYLGIDGGGSKTAFLLIDERGHVLARHAEGAAYYPQVGVPAVRTLLQRGIATVLDRGEEKADALSFAFLGLPSYGEDSDLLPRLNALPEGLLPAARYACGNDVVCGWAGALAGSDGINIVAGTGSIAYGEYRGKRARAGGWGELFSDEGSAYWISREGLSVFSQMSDGRLPRTSFYALVRKHFALSSDLDLCARIYGDGSASRTDLASLAPLVTEAATAGDVAAQTILANAARELTSLVAAVCAQLAPTPGEPLPVSWSGSVFRVPQVRSGFIRELARMTHLKAVAPRLPPDAGAALQAARLAGTPLDAAAISALETAVSCGP
jgi:N-acetylglucosamine kinase-like BadF-type ATPase